jgi:hypothetical protein
MKRSAIKPTEKPTEVSVVKVYEDESKSADGMNIEMAIHLHDDGRFYYYEQWSDYAGIGGVTVEGRWRHAGAALAFLPESMSGRNARWEVGRERRAFEVGDTLDFGIGFTLRVPPEREEMYPVYNNGRRPLTVVIEPPGTRHTVAPGEGVRVVARGPGGMGGLYVKPRGGGDEVVVQGWSGSRLEVIPEPPRSPPRARVRPAGARRPVKPAVARPAPAPVEERQYPRFEPRTPSPELAARIGQWVDELPTKGRPDWLVRLCQQNKSVPLKSTQFYLWVLRADGQVLCIDRDSGPQKAEPESDPRTAYAVLARGARVYPEIGELLPPDMGGLRQCERCGGEGGTPAPPPSKGTDSCLRCNGMGWY